MCEHGSTVLASIDAPGHLFVQSNGSIAHYRLAQRSNMIGAVETAAALNHFGVLPRAEHEKYTRQRGLGTRAGHGRTDWSQVPSSDRFNRQPSGNSNGNIFDFQGR